MNRTLALIISILLLSPQALAEMYRCTDQSGNIVYSTSPCPESSAQEQVERSGRDNQITVNTDQAQKYDYEQNPANFEETQPKKRFRKIDTISRGKPVDIREYVEDGKYTAFMFYADWCPSCMRVRPQVQKYTKAVNTMALREINILNWESPVVKQYGIRSIPYFFVYGPDGNLIQQGNRISNETYKKIASGK